MQIFNNPGVLRVKRKRKAKKENERMGGTMHEENAVLRK